eukprot:TRINITY_DN59796_c0_g1_i1.p4 TRINITY_DN59796_c0_g1~~TRINITY_DN59796_c0_g1_i1.p4  ORF type:complete len:130 (+),score=17.27 TRINITY_DN59796_c0_g1_i1:25-390(+)
MLAGESSFEPESVGTSNGNERATFDDIWEYANRAKNYSYGNQKAIVVVDTQQTPGVLGHRHAYVVYGFGFDAAGRRYVKLFNPHGKERYDQEANDPFLRIGEDDNVNVENAYLFRSAPLLN